jgi:FkbM family methyltransferase
MKIRHYNKVETDWLYKEIFEDGTYANIKSEETGEEIKLEFKSGMNIVDVGGNIGMFALYAWMQCGGSATIHSFEPMPAIHEVLEENCKRASDGSIWDALSGGSVVQAHRVACSTEKGEIEFEFHPYMSLWSTNDAEFDASRKSAMETEIELLIPTIVPVWLFFLRPLVTFLAKQWMFSMQRSVQVKAPTARLTDELDGCGLAASSGKRIDLLKVDVEGAELQVLGGLSDAHWALVDQVAMEVESKANKDAVSALLKKHGLRAVFAPAIKVKGTKEQRVWNVMAVRD